MSDNPLFYGQKRYREAKFIEPENVIKRKVGSGGIDPIFLHRAQEVLDKNKFDFKPAAIDLLKNLQNVIQKIRQGKLSGENAIEELMQPGMQLKAQGGMFHYPLVSDIGDILINFLETVADADEDVLGIVEAHHKSITAVINAGMNNSLDVSAKELCAELLNACYRYYKLHGTN
jgi:hypothetical protein